MIPKLRQESHGDDDLTILCPTCDFDYVHHKSETIVIDGEDAYKASKRVRGDVISVPMFCENGHEFQMNIGFHKGRTSIWVSNIKNQI